MTISEKHLTGFQSRDPCAGKVSQIKLSEQVSLLNEPIGMGYHAQNYLLPRVVARFLDLQLVVQSLILANDSDALKNIRHRQISGLSSLYVPASSERVKIVRQ